MKWLAVIIAIFDMITHATGEMKLNDKLPPFWNAVAVTGILIVVIGFPLLFFLRYMHWLPW